MAKKKNYKQPKLGFRKLKNLTKAQIEKLLPNGKLDTGGHDFDDYLGKPDGVCLMEAVAFVTGESHTDHPACADKQLTSIGIGFNDSHTGYYGNKLNELVPAIPALVGSRTDSARVRFKRAKKATQLMLSHYLNGKDKGSSDLEDRIVDELKSVEKLTNRKEIQRAADLFGYLEGFQFIADTYYDLSKALKGLAQFWNPDGLTAKEYIKIMPTEYLYTFINDIGDQVKFLTEVGYIRS